MAVNGEFHIVNIDGYYYFELWANNGQMIFWSRPYSTLSSARAGVDTFKKNIAEIETLDVKRDKNKKYRWRFVKGAQVVEGICFDTKSSAVSNAESVKRFAETAETKDCTKD